MARRLRLGLLALLVATGATFAVLGLPVSLRAIEGPAYDAFQVLLELAGLAWLVPGLVLLLRDDRQPVGWCLVWVGVVNLVQYNDLLLAPHDSPWVALAIDEWLSHTFFAALATIVATFPDGLAARPPRARRRWRVSLAVAWGASAMLLFVPVVGGGMGPQGDGWPNPLPLAVVPAWFGGVAFLLTLGVLMAATVGLVRRGRQQTSLERRRFRMVQSAMSLMMACLVVGLVGGAIWPWTSDTGLAFVPLVASFVVLPTSIMAAILRYGLYDVDRVLSRTVAYSALAVIVTAAYVGPILLLSLAFGRGDDLSVAVATLVAAAAVTPARRRILTAVDRRFDRTRYDAEQEVAAFGARMRDNVDLTLIGQDLPTVVRRTLAPTTVHLWLPNGSQRPAVRSDSRST